MTPSETVGTWFNRTKGSAMGRRRTLVAITAIPILVAGLAAAGLAAAPGAGARLTPLSGPRVEYNVLVADGAASGAAQQAVRSAGGTVERSNVAAGLLTVRAPQLGFTERVASSPAVSAAARVKVMGHVPTAAPVRPRNVVETENRSQSKQGHNTRKAGQAKAGLDPLDNQLWGLKSVRADLARAKQAGDRRVLVGILDTGVDGTHPDLAPNFNSKLSRNFTHDIPVDELGQVVDGPCEFRGCVDPANHDDGGHGTHVAGTIAAAANGLGVSGVAPHVSIVNIRGGQDSGTFFLQPVVDALTYAGDAGLDVVNMSFFVDPWLYNCQANPADTPDQQAEQRIIVTAMKRAMNYAYRHGVTQVVSLGNQHTDLGNPQPDTISPDYPAKTAHARTIDDASCLSLPIEGPHAIGVGAYGPSRAKADYSNYGQHISVSAPGGWFRDYFGTPQYRTNENLILSTYPKNVGIDDGNIDAAGGVTPKGVGLGVQKDCKGSVCGYYQFLQGTSMASPHAAGVAALIVSQYGKGGRNGLTMDPVKVQRVLEATASQIPCPTPATVDYLDEGRDATFTATCVGTKQYNGFYGHGSVDAWAAVTRGRHYLN
jgi:subtilisin family serine protease